MAEDQLDDTFEDIFGDDALDDDSLNMDNIDNINNSTNSNSKTNPVEDVDALLSTNFDDIFDTFDDVLCSDVPRGVSKGIWGDLGASARCGKE